MRKLLLIAICVLLCGTFAAAQKAELGAGWDYLHLDCGGCSDAGVPGGFFVDGTYYLAHAIGITGDFQYHKKTFSGSGGASGRLLSFHGGPRVKGHMGKFEPFAHALFGFTNLNESDPSGSISDNAFSLKLGGGLDVALSPHFALRVGEFNYYMTKFPVTSAVNTNGNDKQNNITFGVGIVIR